MGNRALCAVIGTLTRPSTTFRTISDNPDHYLASSVAIFVAVCLVPALQSITTWPEPDNGTFVGFTSYMLTYLQPLIHTVWLYSPIIAMIFWIGSRYGQRYKFKKIFPVLSYCLTPAILGAIIVLGGIPLVGILLVFVPDDRSDNFELSPSPVLDLTKNNIVFIIQSASTIFFLAWTFLLFGKAIMVLYGFGVGKTVAVLALVALVSYVLRFPLGFLDVLLSSLVR